ncbi:hypothetical protein AX14_005772 [Amanita brunnescens Koide BX004]|nr:hypothetical protein AX14_005772 [Amanita brunnescens Koide BX004]
MTQTPSIDVFAISSPPWLSHLSCLSRFATSHTPRCIIASWTQRRAFPWIRPQYTSRICLADLRRVGQKIRGCHAATDLFEKRSTIYSGRPRMVMADELMGWEWDFLHMTHSDRWRQHRRVFHQSFQSRAIQGYFHVIRCASLVLVSNFAATPGDFVNHIRHFAGGVILRITYGYDVTPRNDEYVRLALAAGGPLLQVVHAGSYLVEYIPALKYIPSWFPGAKFKRQAKEWAKHSFRLRESPFESVKAAIASGKVRPCMVSEFLEKPHDAASEEILKNCAGLAYAAGSDTTASFLESWILAMAMFPDAQRRAREELDSVVGGNRLPDFSDRESLPYLDALLLETLRWNPTVPLGVPHTATEDDVYGGYFIPKGARVVGNYWAISRDEELYPDPEQFIPERFLRQEGKQRQLDPALTGAFGFGRRICPGRHLAVHSIWLAMAYTLTLYAISPATDENGVKIELKRENISGLTVHPKPFRMQLVPRSKDMANLVHVLKDDESFAC